MSASAEPSIPNVGTHIDRYEIVRELGQTSYGKLYRARRSGLDRDVVVQVMSPPNAAPADLKRDYARFSEEARQITRLQHPNAAWVLDYGRTGEGLPYLVVELVQGRTLTRVLSDDGPIPVERLVPIAEQVLGCLAAAHRLGLVHAHLTPSQIVLGEAHGRQDSVKLLGTGMDRVRGFAAGALASPQYMAPEQAQPGAEVDDRTDLYAFGLILAECLSGRAVVQGDGQAARQLQTSPAPLALDPDVLASPLGPIIQRAIRKNPDERYQDVRTMRLEIEDVDARLPIPGLQALAWPSDVPPVPQPAGLSMLTIPPVPVTRFRHGLSGALPTSGSAPSQAPVGPSLGKPPARQRQSAHQRRDQGMASARPAPPPPPPPAQVDAEAAEPWEVPKPRPRVARAAIIGLLASLAAAGALGYYGTHRHHEPEKAPNVGPLLPPSGSTAGGVKRPLAMAPPASHAQPAPPAEAPVVPASPLAPPIQPPGQSSSSANGGNLGQRLNDTMTRAVRRYYSQIAACRSHSTLPTGLALSVDVTMALGPNGQVTSAHSTSADPAASCVLDVVRHMQLDWSGPTPTQITYTFQLP